MWVEKVQLRPACLCTMLKCNECKQKRSDFKNPNCFDPLKNAWIFWIVHWVCFTIVATSTVLCFENMFSSKRHVVARLLYFHNPHLCSVGDEPTLVSADPQATPLNRNAEPHGLVACHFCKREQIFKLHHIHVKLRGVFTSPIASQETHILSEWFGICFNRFSSNFSDCEM